MTKKKEAKKAKKAKEYQPSDPYKDLRYLRIIGNGYGYHSLAYNAETGEELTGISQLTLEIGMDRPSTARFTRLMAFGATPDLSSAISVTRGYDDLGIGPVISAEYEVTAVEVIILPWMPSLARR